MISTEDKREMGKREEEMGSTSKERVMIYILSKLEYIFTGLLQRGNVTVDSLQTRWGFYSGVQTWSFNVANRFLQGNQESLQTDMVGRRVSHEIFTDGALRR
ncbi:hypothetical protein GOODEAATRI_004321 [Goodea atripinnis]|uniref:Uncharacterized protein n=1 Tax=Goodea atripinnis TaxID=208336 RepID=A0ABV0NHD5_9TELE